MKKVYYTPAQINSYLLTIARQMYTDQFHPEYIIGLSRGGLVPAIKLSHYLNIPMYALNKEESNLWIAEDAYNGTNMLIIDDINDTGKTIQWVKQDFRSGCVPKDEKWENIWTTNARFAVCIDNEASNEFVSYSGHTINKFENPEWCVFPWEEWWITTLMKDWASYKQNWYTAVIQVESDEKFREIVKWVENNVEGHRKHTIWSVTEYRKLTIKFRHQKDYAWFVLRWQ